jgi:hypothetical protein
MSNQPDFLKRHPFFASALLLVAMEIGGHALWLVGIVPDNNFGGDILWRYPL